MIEKSPGYLSGHFFLTAALAMEGDQAAAVEACGTLRSAPAGILAGLDD